MLFFKNLPLLLTASIILSACGDTHENKTNSNQSINIKDNGHLSHLLIAMKGAIDGQSFNTSPNGQNNMAIKNVKLYPMSNDKENKSITLMPSSQQVVFFNNSKNADDWRCYAVTEQLEIAQSNLGLHINGQVQEYKYIPSHNDCSNQKLSLFTFDNVSITDQLTISDGDVTEETNKTTKKIVGSDLLLMKLKQQNAYLFGVTWAEMQSKYLDNALQQDTDLLSYNPKTDFVTVKEDSQTTSVVPFNQLNKETLLAGQLFDGSTSKGIASNKWCQIVNIPHNTDDSQKYQAVIAMNCARAENRWCDGYGSSFKAGTYPATHTIAWNEALTYSAMENSKAMIKQGQGHWIVNNAAQNVFLNDLDNAINPIFGYTNPRNDGKINNAGANSWTGHMGHCQNVMSQDMQTFAVTWIKDKNNIRSYWTQDFAR